MSTPQPAMKLGSPRHLGVTEAPPHHEMPAYESMLSNRDPIASCTPYGQRSRRRKRIRAPSGAMLR